LFKCRNIIRDNEKNQFAHCPDFVIEVKSNSDNLKSLTIKYIHVLKMVTQRVAYQS